MVARGQLRPWYASISESFQLPSTPQHIRPLFLLVVPQFYSVKDWLLLVIVSENSLTAAVILSCLLITHLMSKFAKSLLLLTKTGPCSKWRWLVDYNYSLFKTLSAGDKSAPMCRLEKWTSVIEMQLDSMSEEEEISGSNAAQMVPMLTRVDSTKLVVRNFYIIFVSFTCLHLLALLEFALSGYDCFIDRKSWKNSTIRTYEFPGKNC